VLRETIWLVSGGIALGIPIVLVSRRLIENMLYGLHGSELASLLLSVLLLLAVAVVAGLLPAQRASKVDPMVALRYE
jgi:ABC-type antimicrobial peptide transport system permease subunit